MAQSHGPTQLWVVRLMSQRLYIYTLSVLLFPVRLGPESAVTAAGVVSDYVVLYVCSIQSGKLVTRHMRWVLIWTHHNFIQLSTRTNYIPF